MSPIVYRISVLLGATLTESPVGTNLGLFWLLWALIYGRFLLSRGAVFPALADGGLPADAVRRSGAALAYGRWAIQPPLGWQHTNGYTKVRWWLSDAAMALVEAIDRKEPVTPGALVLDNPTKAAHEAREPEGGALRRN